jgi:hypothetical protein
MFMETNFKKTDDLRSYPILDTVSVPLFNTEWVICFVEFQPGRDQLFGQTEFPSRTIYVSDLPSKFETKKTVLHELTHASLYVLGQSSMVRTNRDDCFYEPVYSEEELCEFMACNAVELLKVYKLALSYDDFAMDAGPITHLG